MATFGPPNDPRTVWTAHASEDELYRDHYQCYREAGIGMHYVEAIYGACMPAHSWPSDALSASREPCVICGGQPAQQRLQVSPPVHFCAECFRLRRQVVKK